MLLYFQVVTENPEVLGVQNADFATICNRIPADRLIPVGDELTRRQNDETNCSSSELHDSVMESDEVNVKTEINDTKSLFDVGHETIGHDGGEISGLQVTDISHCSYESTNHDLMSICLKGDTDRKLHDYGLRPRPLGGQTDIARRRQTRNNPNSRHRETFELARRKRKVSAAKKLFKCDECHRFCRSPSELAQHKHTHSGDKPYVCETCNKAFSRPFTLQKHQQTHAARPAHECDICHQTFGYAGRLSIHKRIHRDVKPQICDVCNEVFIGAENLSSHKRTHSGKPPAYACEICNRRFSRPSHVATHKRFHSEDKRYVCGVCNIAFGQLHNLEEHKRIHSTEKGYKCYMCDTVFNDVGDLIVHRLVHSVDRQLVCDICNMAFYDARKLSRHKRCHTSADQFT